ncbi:MAG: ATP-binding cassette domain-containing protein [Streptosporangiales bacterium]|nr:ATP-binding cassette domain-containing protein [Streptosporangiales bacterium]
MQVATTNPSPPELLRVSDLVTTFQLRRGLSGRGSRVVHAVSGVSFSVAAGETFGLVGESGCGKSTVARTIVGLERPSSGTVVVDGQDVHDASRASVRAAKRAVQMVFQDPYSSLNPRMTVRQLLTEAWLVHSGIVPRGEWDTEVHRLLDLVGLPAESADRYPAQFSGGQLQRISIARALAVRPRLLIADEAVSALDVSIQAQVLNLLAELQRELGLALVFISHDLSVVRHLCQRVAVMYLGKLVEIGEVEQIYREPTHPYTQTLINAVPDLYPWQVTRTPTPTTDDDIPSPTDPPSGCRFRTRCWKATQRCAEEEPALDDRGLSHPSACHFASLPELTDTLENR